VSFLRDPLNDSTLNSRLAIWLSALDAAGKAPFLGRGEKDFKNVSNPQYVREHYAELTQRFGKSIIDNDTAKASHTHNQFLQVLVAQGGIGLFFFLGLLAWPLFMCIKQRDDFGLLLPLILHFCIFSLTDVSLFHSSGTYFPAFVIFSALGYFSCLDFSKRQI
jgi:O-antigen ligase